MLNIRNGPKFIHLDLTGACNLKCIHCRATSKFDKNELSEEEIISFIRYCKNKFKNFNHILIGGGEPLLKKDILFRVLDECKKLGIKTSLNTNATLIDNKNAKKIAKISDGTQVSLDGACSSTHESIRGVKNSFDKTLRGIRFLVRNKAKNLYVRMTINKLNYLEYSDFIDLGIKLGVDAVSFYRTIPVGRANSTLTISPETYNLILREITKLKYKIKSKIGIACGDPIKIVFDERIQKLAKDKTIMSGCLPGIAEFFVNNIGNVYPCTMLPLKLGNIRETKIDNLWQNSRILKTLRNRNNLKGNCKKCNFNLVCGGCRAVAYGEKGDYLGEDPFCSKNLKQKNLFREEGGQFFCRTC